MFDNPETLQKKVDEYFEWVKGEIDPDSPIQLLGGRGYKREPEPITITGLCLFLGFDSRQSFYDYEEKPEFTYIIKNARMRVENAYEKGLYGGKPVGSIFALKNMGWADKTEVDQNTKHSGGIAISWEDPPIQNTDDQGSH